MNREYAKIILIISLSIILEFSLFPYSSAQGIWVRVYTDKSEYPYFRELVEVYGNISFQGEPAEDAVAAIQVQYPNKTTMLLRTVSTSLNPSWDWQLEIVSVIPCDQLGEPKNDFSRGSVAYCNVTVKSNRFTSRHALIVITAFDPDSTPLDIVWLECTIAGDGVAGMVAPIGPIPHWSSTGTSKMFASVLTDWPINGGYPYCPGKSADFNVYVYGESTYSSPSVYPQSAIEVSNYSMTFRLPPHVPIDTYDVRISAFYKNFDSWGNTTFTTISHELGDFDYDRDIDLFDAVSILAVYGVKSGGQGWDPRLDLLPNGHIELYDAVVVLCKYGTKY